MWGISLCFKLLFIFLAGHTGHMGHRKIAWWQSRPAHKISLPSRPAYFSKLSRPALLLNFRIPSRPVPPISVPGLSWRKVPSVFSLIFQIDLYLDDLHAAVQFKTGRTNKSPSVLTSVSHWASIKQRVANPVRIPCFIHFVWLIMKWASSTGFQSVASFLLWVSCCTLCGIRGCGCG